MRTETVRAFNGSDSYMLETANTLHSLFVASLADFTNFDTELDAAFGTTWLASIDAAGTVVRDSQVKDILAQKTDDVLAQMELCVLKYNEVKYFASKVFPKNIARQAEFGTDTYLAARRSQAKMVLFMDEMHKACVKYQTELVAGGFTAPQIAEILTLHTALLNANTVQEGYLKGRPVLTQERVETLNTAYTFMRTVIEAANVIYYNDFARRNQYVYLSGGGSGNNGGGDDSVVVTAVVNSQVAVELANIPYENARQFRFTNNGPGVVDFYLADDPNNITGIVTIQVGEVSVRPSIELGVSGNSLFAKLPDEETQPANVEVVYSLEV